MASEKDNVQEALKEFSIKPGDKFRHYKVGGIYEVVTLAVKEDTLEPLVVYYSREKDSTWVRTYENFTEDVEVNETFVKRFQPI